MHGGATGPELGFPEKSLVDSAKILASTMGASFDSDALQHLTKLVIDGTERLRTDGAVQSRLGESRDNLDNLVRRTFLIAKQKERNANPGYTIDTEAAAEGGGAQGGVGRVNSSLTLLKLSDFLEALRGLCPLYPFC